MQVRHKSTRVINWSTLAQKLNHACVLKSEPVICMAVFNVGVSANIGVPNHPSHSDIAVLVPG